MELCGTQGNINGCMPPALVDERRCSTGVPRSGARTVCVCGGGGGGLCLGIACFRFWNTTGRIHVRVVNGTLCTACMRSCRHTQDVTNRHREGAERKESRQADKSVKSCIRTHARTHTKREKGRERERESDADVAH